MRKICAALALLLLLLGTFMLTACRGGGIEAPEYDPLAEEEPEFTFTLLDDGTYSVAKGDFHLYREVTVPATYNGKPVTKIDKKGFAGCMGEKITLPDSITEIGDSAFSGCVSLSSITLPKSLKEIPSSAFENCVSLKEVIIPESVTAIGAGAFEGCTALTALSLHEGVTSIGNAAFYDCKKLATLSLPSTLLEVGEDAFAVLGYNTFIKPNDLVYNNLNGDLYLGNEKNPYVVLIRIADKNIPSYTVNENTRVIYSNTFSSSALSEITLHENVKSIGAYAFAWCSNLERVHIPDGVITLGDSAFQSCRKLTDITGMKNVVSVGERAFSSCAALKNLALSDNLTTVGAGAFSGTNALITTVEDNVSYIGSAENPHKILLKATDLTKTAYHIHENTKIIYQGAFQKCEKLEKITVPEGVVTLGSNAFRDCKALTDVSLPSTLTSVGVEAFRNCKALFAPVIPENVVYIGSGVFSGCSFSKVTLPFIGEYASGAGNTLFGHIFGISDVGQHPTKIPKNLCEVVLTNCTTLGAGAFSDCLTITTITLPKNLKVINSGAFYFTKALKKVYINDLATWCAVDIPNTSATPMTYGGSLYLNDKKLENAVIPEGVSEIKTYTFYGCQSITSLDVPGTVKKIGDSAFEGCTNIASVSIGDGTETVGCAAFKNCEALTHVTLPNTVTLIDSNAFRGCLTLQEIVLPKSLTFLADHVFKNCDALEKVTFSDKSGWYLCETRLLFNPEKVSVRWAKTNAKRLTGDEVILYWVKGD